MRNGWARWGMGLAMAGALMGQPIAAAVRIVPVSTGAETQRFLRGTATLSLETATGAVAVTPLPLDHGHLAFGVAVLNKGAVPADFGVENVDAAINGRLLAVLPAVELERRAKSRAVWTQVGIAVLAGAAAGIAAGAHTTTRAGGHVRGPGGDYRWAARTRDHELGAVGAGAAAAGGAAGIASVHDRLDRTLGELAEDVVQTTTVDPQASYGGRLVLEKPAGGRLPHDLLLAIHWNGADYPFTFRVTEGGQGAPVPPAVAAAAPVAPVEAPGPIRPAVLVAPVPPSDPALLPVAMPATPRIVPQAIAAPAPQAPAAAYRNGRDDAIIVPMQ